ncbi:MAG: nitroreductase family protein, partial [Candidatus Hodarchaeota archaeon]
MSTTVLDTIKNRRTVFRFTSDPVTEEMLQTVLEAGRWAPSWTNTQPWNFLLITDQNIKERLSEVAPVCIAVVVDATKDRFHLVEDGAAATQNMALAAHSLGLNSSWIGIFDIENRRKSAEVEVRKILGIPKTHRVISLL